MGIVWTKNTWKKKQLKVIRLNFLPPKLIFVIRLSFLILLMWFFFLIRSFVLTYRINYISFSLSFYSFIKLSLLHLRSWSEIKGKIKVWLACQDRGNVFKLSCSYRYYFILFNFCETEKFLTNAVWYRVFY